MLDRLGKFLSSLLDRMLGSLFGLLFGLLSFLLKLRLRSLSFSGGDRLFYFFLENNWLNLVYHSGRPGEAGRRILIGEGLLL